MRCPHCGERFNAPGQTAVERAASLSEALFAQPPGSVLSRSHKPGPVLARKAVVLACLRSGMTLVRTGALIGRDHTTVRDLELSAARLFSEDEDFAECVRIVTRALTKDVA